jgi:prepilin-type N-terminal cleavage/methylation domain-containing protein
MMQKHRKKFRDRRAGMTLLEILIVVLVMGILLSVAIPSFNSITHLRLKQNATRIAGVIRYLYSQAALKGLCMRLVFDLKNNIYRVEASTDGQCLIDSEQHSAIQAKRLEKKRRKAALKKQKSSDTTTTVGGWGGEKPISLDLKKATFERYNKGLLRRYIMRDTKFLGIFVIHQKGVYSKKRGPQYAYLHCFPLGRCERAVIYLQDSRQTILSLEVSPLTGRVKIHKGKLKLQDYHTNWNKGEDDASNL